jgi:hypothetical protein
LNQTMAEVMPIEPWDGRLENWEEWFAMWSLYADVLYAHIPDEKWVWLLIRNFPENYRTIVLTRIKNDGWNYQRVIEYVRQECHDLVPAQTRRAKWLQMRPIDATYEALQSWYPGWKRSLRDLAVDEVAAAEQFITTLRGLFPDAIRQLLETVFNHPHLSLDDKFNFVLQKARILQHLRSFENGVNPVVSTVNAVAQDAATPRNADRSDDPRERSTANRDRYDGRGYWNSSASPARKGWNGKGNDVTDRRNICYRCGKPGHWAAQCPEYPSGGKGGKSFGKADTSRDNTRDWRRSSSGSAMRRSTSWGSGRERSNSRDSRGVSMDRTPRDSRDRSSSRDRGDRPPREREPRRDYEVVVPRPDGKSPPDGTDSKDRD